MPQADKQAGFSETQTYGGFISKCTPIMSRDIERDCDGLHPIRK
jgi:hypothetical protein